MLSVYKTSRSNGSKTYKLREFSNFEIVQANTVASAVDKQAEVVLIKPFEEFVKPKDRVKRPRLTEGEVESYKRVAVLSIALGLILDFGVHGVQEIIDGTPCKPGPTQVAVNREQKSALTLKLKEAKARSVAHPFNLVGDPTTNVASLAEQNSAEHILILDKIKAADQELGEDEKRCEFPLPNRQESDTWGTVINADIVDNIHEASQQLDVADKRREEVERILERQLHRRILIA